MENSKDAQEMRKLLITGILSILCLLFVGCTETEQDEPNTLVNYTKFEKYLIDGCKVKIEQIYLMPGAHTIPNLDEPVDELFKPGQTLVNLGFQTLNYQNDYILNGLEQGEVWSCDFNSDTTIIYYELGYGSTYQVMERTDVNYYEIITCDSKYGPRLFAAEWRPDNPYNYRGRENITFNIQTYHNNKWEQTNLKLTVLTFSGKALFESEDYFYMDTNGIYELGQFITAPLTGSQVAQIIQNGTEGVDYELYLSNGYTTYKIGENFYIPTIFNTYKYVGTTNQNGMINGYTYHYYRFKFRFVE
ncbi:MAG: hypothetical protein LBS43_05465 [Prevotellaceae bacterium]|jgi:hypothetical protein|nr:hypothetical protein [Prevotellaceae bacterium]